MFFRIYFASSFIRIIILFICSLQFEEKGVFVSATLYLHSELRMSVEAPAEIGAIVMASTRETPLEGAFLYEAVK